MGYSNIEFEARMYDDQTTPLTVALSQDPSVRKGYSMFVESCKTETGFYNTNIAAFNHFLPIFMSENEKYNKPIDPDYIPELITDIDFKCH